MQEGGYLLWTWDDFKDYVTKHFKHIVPVFAAQEKLHNLTLKGKGIEKYTKEFTNIIQDIPQMAETEKIDQYTFYLSHNIRLEIFTRDIETLD